MPTSNYQPMRLLDLDCCNKFTSVLNGKQCRSGALDLQCLQMKGISGFSRTRVKVKFHTKLLYNTKTKGFFSNCWLPYSYVLVFKIVNIKLLRKQIVSGELQYHWFSVVVFFFFFFTKMF